MYQMGGKKPLIFFGYWNRKNFHCKNVFLLLRGILLLHKLTYSKMLVHLKALFKKDALIKKYQLMYLIDISHKNNHPLPPLPLKHVGPRSSCHPIAFPIISLLRPWCRLDPLSVRGLI